MTATSNKRYSRQAVKALLALLLLFAPYLLFPFTTQAQTSPVPQSTDGMLMMEDAPPLTEQARKTEGTAPKDPYTNPVYTNLATQFVEQNQESLLQEVNSEIDSDAAEPNQVFTGLNAFFDYTIINNLFRNAWKLIARWVEEWLVEWVAPAVQFLTACLRTFVLNPNIAVNGLGNTNDDGGLSKAIRGMADIMYGVAVDLLLILFILCIWKFWAESAWRGGGNLMGSVGRLIFTAGLLLAWPTLYAFEIQITNEMIKAIYFNSASEVAQLDATLAMGIKLGITATAAGLAYALAPVALSTIAGGLGGSALGPAGAAAGGMIGGTIGGIVSFVALIVFSILGVGLILELLYILILKAIQMALLAAQYMFGPFFLVFFATPDTENIATGYVRSCIEISLWTFCWVGLLRLLAIVATSDFNPWGKVLMAVGVLQIMIQVPGFLAKAQISPMSDLITAGLVTGLFFNGLNSLAKMADQRTWQGLVDYPHNQQYSSRGLKQTINNAADGTAGANQNDGLFNGMRDSFKKGSEDAKKQAGLVPPPKDPKLMTDDEKKQQKLREEAAEANKLAAMMDNASGKPIEPADGTGQASRADATLANPGQTGQTGRADATAANALGSNPPGLSPTGRPNANRPGVNNVNNPAATAGPAGMASKLGPSGLGQGAHDSLLSHAAALSEANPFPNLMNARDDLNYSGYKNVDPRLLANDIRTFEGISMQTSHDNDNHLVFDGKGKLHHVRIRPGASAQETARVLRSAADAQRFNKDPAAFDAARESAIDAGEDGPQGFMESAAAGFMAYKGSSFKTTATAKQRFSRSLSQHALAGSEAFRKQQPGNDYTEYLNDLWGGYGPSDDAWTSFIMTTAESASSPWHPSHMVATKACLENGIVPNEANRNAASHWVVRKQPMWARTTAIRAVSMYIDNQAKQAYPAPGGDEAKLDGDTRLLRDSYMSGMVHGMGESTVRACIEEYQSCGNDPNKFNDVKVISTASNFATKDGWRDPDISQTINVVADAQCNYLANNGSMPGVSVSFTPAPGGGPLPGYMRQSLERTPDFWGVTNQVIQEMRQSGFSSEQMKDPGVVNLCYGLHAGGNNHMMSQARETMRIMGPITSEKMVYAYANIMDANIPSSHVTQENIFYAIDQMEQQQSWKVGIDKDAMNKAHIDLDMRLAQERYRR